jgi:CarD family transcriptional regulator
MEPLADSMTEVEAKDSSAEATPYSVGDKVMHPSHGPGRITGITHQELVKGFKHYFVIALSDKATTVQVPVRKMEELGIRPVMSRAEIALMLEHLKSTPQDLPRDHRERQALIEQMIQSRRPMQMAEAVRDLVWYGKQDHLTAGNQRLLTKGRGILASEMALALDVSVVEAEGAIHAALSGLHA